MHPKISSLTPPDFSNIKTTEQCESPFHQEAPTKVSSKSDYKKKKLYHFCNEVEITKYSEIFASRTPNFPLFLTFYSDSKMS